MTWTHRQIFVAAALVMFAQAVSGKALANQIEQSKLDMAFDAAEQIADELAAKLRAEKSEVIFLDTPTCSMSSSWCKAFLGRLTTELSDQRIRFLSESAAKAIRTKIAQEQIYQQSSQMVDVKKAVELGRQDAFHAFVTLSVSGDVDSSYLYIQGQSIRIEAASVTISLFKTIKTKKDQTRSWGRLLGGSFIMGLGLAGAHRSNELVLYHQQMGDDVFEMYKNADNAETATAWRGESERHDARAKEAKNAAIASWFVVGVGALYLLAGAEETIAYEIVQKRDVGRHSYATSFTVSPFADPSSLGVYLAWDL